MHMKYWQKNTIQDVDENIQKLLMKTSLGHPYKECVGRVQGTGFGWEAREGYFKES